MGDSFGRGAEDFRQADWLSEELEGTWRYDHTAQRWHHWDGTRWAPDETEHIVFTVAERARLALARGTWSVGGASLSTDDAKALVKLLNVPVARRALEALATMPAYATNGDDWDQVPYLLGVENGVVDLRTNTLVEHPEPSCLVTKTTGVRFEPATDPEQFAARAPLFMAFMEDVMSGDPSMVAFLLLWFGSSLFGMSPEQRFLLMTGIGRNGKGALKHSVMKAVGEYGAQFDANLYMRSKLGAARSDGARADLLALKGKRITFFSEPEGNRFNEELLKAHTGGDRITARALYSNNVQSWDPTHSITFLVNDAPEVDDLGPSMTARVMVADFRERYDGEREDKRLYGKLEREAEGILAILCWAASAWWASWDAGGHGLTLPERVQEQSRRFMERNDPLAQFINERCETGLDLRTGSAHLYGTFLEWWRASGQAGEAPSQVRFSQMMERKGFKKVKGRTSNDFRGIQPLSAWQLADRDDSEEE